MKEPEILPHEAVSWSAQRVAGESPCRVQTSERTVGH